MKFDTIWNCDYGSTVTVSNGWVQPDDLKSAIGLRWKKFNFTGVFSGKGTGKYGRYLEFTMGTARRKVWDDFDYEFTTTELTSSAFTEYDQELFLKLENLIQSKISAIDALIIYAKWQEIRDIDAIGFPAVQAMTQQEREARFPFLSAELTENPGMTQLEAYNDFAAETSTKMAKAAKAEARRARLKDIIAAATTQAEKDAAANTSWDDI